MSNERFKGRACARGDLIRLISSGKKYDYRRILDGVRYVISRACANGRIAQSADMTSAYLQAPWDYVPEYPDHYLEVPREFVGDLPGHLLPPHDAPNLYKWVWKMCFACEISLKNYASLTVSAYGDLLKKDPRSSHYPMHSSFKRLSNGRTPKAIE